MNEELDSMLEMEETEIVLRSFQTKTLNENPKAAQNELQRTKPKSLVYDNNIILNSINK